MMHRKLLTAGAGLALVIGTVGCDNITGLNKNPNSPEDVPAASLFTSAVRLAGQRWLGTAYDLRGTSLVAQHLAEVQYPDEDRYARLTAASTRTFFDNPYPGELKDFQVVIDKGRAQSEPGIYAPALVMRTWVFSYLTDTWGDIPYFEALKGDSGALQPAYDPQQAIYDDFFSVLDEAETSLQSASAALGDADPIYGGDPVQWQKLANSLRARYAMRIVNVDPTKANQELQAAFAGPLIETNADNAIVAWPGDGVYNNPWADNFKSRDDHRMSQSLMNILNANSDPRTGVFAMPAQAGGYAGMPNGLTADVAGTYATTASRPGAIFYPGVTAYGTFGGSGARQESYIMTAAEVLFIKAEAAERSLGGLTPSQAKGFYDAAITASMEQWGITGSAVATYLSSGNVAYAGGSGNSVSGLDQIAIQKWIALFTQGGQAWFEWRRTCQPSTIVPGPAAIINTVPRRFQYSPTEYTVNAANLEAAVARQGADDFETPVWWDSNPSVAPTYPGPSCGTAP